MKRHKYLEDLPDIHISFLNEQTETPLLIEKGAKEI